MSGPTPLALHLNRVGSGEPVLFLHGFPEIARYWAPLMRSLAADFDCIAPDQRGCGDSPRPPDPDDYAVPALLADVSHLLDRLNLPSVHLVGHDWGGVLAWWFAATQPQRVRRLVVFNAPHPVALQSRLLTDPRQQAASVYMPRLQQPGAAAALLADGPAAFWHRLRGEASGFDAADRAAYLQAWGAPDGLHGPVAWYRQSPFVMGPSDQADGVNWHQQTPLRVTVPTLIAWGLLDPTFVPELIDDSAAFAPQAQVQRFADGLHNLPRERTAECATLLRGFLTTEPNTVTAP
jgi:epoxide hydrolase 4